MNSTLSKLIKIVDELLFFHRYNPQINVPESEKKRLLLVLNKIINSEAFTLQEWEHIKPNRPEPPEVNNIRKARLSQDRIKDQIKKTNDLNKDLINQTKKLQDEILKSETELRIRIARINGKLPAIQNRKVCKKCRKWFTEGDYSNHIKVCGKKKKRNLINK